MRFNRLNTQDLEYLKSIVALDGLSTGESNLDLHSRDMSRHPPSRPEVVIWPSDKDQVSKILSYANERLIPVTAWGAGTSLEGNPIPVNGGIALDFSRMNRILAIRADDFQVDVEPGLVYTDLNRELRHTGLFFPPDPGTAATIGGMIANNASGTRTVRYGSTKDHVQSLTVVMADGKIVKFGNRASKSSSGFDLLHLFIGSEGMLGIVVEATLRLVGIQEELASAIGSFPTVRDASKAVVEIIRAGVDPAALELLATECVELINRMTDLRLAVAPTLFMEFHGASRNQLAELLEIAREISLQQGCQEFRSGLERAERDRMIKARYSMGEMIRKHHPNHARIVVDVAVPISAYPQMIAFAREEAQRVPTPMAYIFGHAGDGNIHLVIGAKEDDMETWRAIYEANDRIVNQALALGGTATGEHGVGIGKSKFMRAEHGNALDWMKKVKQLFDPNGILNPGKMFP